MCRYHYSRINENLDMELLNRAKTVKISATGFAFSGSSFLICGSMALNMSSLQKRLISMQNIQNHSSPSLSKDVLPSTTESQSRRRRSMEPSDSIVAVSSPPESALLSEADSLFASLLCDITQQVHVGMENMLKMMNNIDQCSNEIVEDLEKCKKSTIERKKMLEDDKESFQKAALSVLDILNNEVLSKNF